MPSEWPPERNRTLAALLGTRSSTSRTTLGPAGTDQVSEEPACASTYAPPLYCASPVHADGGVTTLAGPLSVAASAWTGVSAERDWMVPLDCASAARSGLASSVCMVSRPWIVDSAPELWLIVRSPLTPSKVTPVAGSYVGTPTLFCPKNQPAANPASLRTSCRPDARPTEYRPCTRASAPYAIWVRSSAEGSIPFTGPYDASRPGVKPAASDSAGRSSDLLCSAPDAAARADGICAPQA